MTATATIDALRQPTRGGALAWPVSGDEWERLNDQLDRFYEHLVDLYAAFPDLIPASGGGGKLVPIFSTQPTPGIGDFWPALGGAAVGWDAIGNADVGVCLRTQSDGAFVQGYNPGGGFGINFTGAIFFEADGLDPATVITSVQFRARLTGVAAGFLWQIAASGTAIPLVGVASPFTGDDLFASAVYTTHPDTGLPWTFDDVFAQAADPFTGPTAFQGWYGISVSSPATAPDSEVLNIDYFDCLVNGGGGGGTVSTTVVDYLASQVKPYRRTRLDWPANVEQWSELNDQMDDLYLQLQRVYDLLPIVAGVEDPPA